MWSIDIANTFIEEYGDRLQLTNLKLNKLIYFTQVEALHNEYGPIFDDPIEAWEYGPVEPMVYFNFRDYGRGIIDKPLSEPICNEPTKSLIQTVASTYGKLSAFDLVSVSHRKGGAWSNRYEPNENNVITISDIESSIDIGGFSSIGETFPEKIDQIKNSIPNALRMLQNS